MKNKRLLILILLILICILLCLELKEKKTYRIEEVMGKKGLSFTQATYPDDIEAVNADWFYTYGVATGYLSDLRYTPMVTEPNENLPNDYDGYVLVFNEPDNAGIGGDPHSPEDAAAIYLTLLEEYPNAKFVVGGTTEGNTEWAIEFLAEIESSQYPERWHVHKYVPNSDYVEDSINAIINFHDAVNAPIWVTEIGSQSADVDALRSFMIWLEVTDYVERYAVFPTRIKGDEAWFPSHWSVDMALIDYDTGTLTEMGLTYRDLDINILYLPAVFKDAMILKKLYSTIYDLSQELDPLVIRRPPVVYAVWMKDIR